MVKIGQGNVTSGNGCQGVLRVVESVEDVLGLMKEDISNVILLTPTASATIMTPRNWNSVNSVSARLSCLPPSRHPVMDSLSIRGSLFPTSIHRSA